MSLPSAGVKSNFRRFEEIIYNFNEKKAEIGDVGNLLIQVDTFVEAINTLLTSVQNLSTEVFEKTSKDVVIFGLETEAQTVPDMTVKVKYGVAYDTLNTRHSIDEVPALTIAEADATNPRIDVVYLDQYGEIGVVTGTPAAEPAAPAKPQYSLLLAEIAVATNATVIEQTNITDKRTIIVK